MLVRRLTWCGLEIEAAGTTVVVDLLENTPELTRWAGPPRENLLAPVAPAGSLRAAAITHDHSDHFDVDALRSALAPDAPVLCPAATAAKVTAAGLHALGAELWETVAVGALTLRAVPAVDGLGAAQVSWVISHGDRRVLHCGDTLWHGFWWQIVDRCGPIDIAFVPVNGVTVDFDDLQPPSRVPAVLTPEQAAAAVAVLGAREAIPIHYGTFDKAPLYVGVPNAANEFLAAAKLRGVNARELKAGEKLELSPSLVS
jgi:L-ascorbate metabolism protein UlaG (beta-lactamase superfamily)